MQPSISLTSLPSRHQAKLIQRLALLILNDATASGSLGCVLAYLNKMEANKLKVPIEEILES
jgi:hypothetical protein